ncbi:MAG TPA: alpha/beta hydrolase [Solirubrobacteraceae bacterium]
MAALKISSEVHDNRAEIDDLAIFWRSVAAPGTPIVYVHGVPNSSHMWLGFLPRTGGIALDLPGFGRSAKRGDFDHSIAGYDAFLEAFLEHLGIDRLALVMHDWGALALVFAQRFPERIERMVLINPVPLLPGYRWHWVARIWRRRLLGELAMGAITKPALRLISRQANVAPGPLPADFIDDVHGAFDQGTQRAVLGLYRSADPDVLAAAGERLAAIDAPALIVWGERDPYIPPKFAGEYAARLPHAEVHRVPGAGHWPWLDDPGVIDEVCAYVTAPR